LIKYLVFSAALLFIAYVEGFLNPFVVWNALPFGLGFGFVRQAERGNRPLGAAVGFSIGAGGLSLLFHCAWLFDWGGTASGSSTSGIAFLFLPVFALVPGAIGRAIGRGLDRRRNRIESRPNHHAG
jgi:hypothetical protein